ncbi:hypothetical protein B0H16DRAFT_439433 [Mycena metata]|uniref:Uncharacterized protein n=1 Tax=Mycena metata TaxID=1033252 RepID=A0AAD7HD58_9AGAR|nr:hypothetical protein B0H16DRAFT_439433 [Mycena metata]
MTSRVLLPLSLQRFVSTDSASSAPLIECRIEAECGTSAIYPGLQILTAASTHSESQTHSCIRLQCLTVSQQHLPRHTSHMLQHICKPRLMKLSLPFPGNLSNMWESSERNCGLR